MPIIKEPN
jgi:hypothetical protein